MKNVSPNANPYVVAPTGDTAGYPENELAVLASASGQQVVLPSISSLRAGDMTIFVYASGQDCEVSAQGGNVIIGATGTVKKDTAVEYTAITPLVWFAR